MDNQIELIASRIKELRLIEGITTADMAGELNITEEYYIDCEAGKNDFSFTFVHKCAKLLGVDITELISGNEAKLSTATVVRAGCGMPLERRKGFRYNHMASNFHGRLAEPFVVVAKFDSEAQNRDIPLSRHEGQEFDYILEGSLKVVVAGHTDILNPGDTIYYNSSEPHGMIATGGGDCKFIAMVIDAHGRAAEYNGAEEKTAERQLKNVSYGRFVSCVEDEAGSLVSISFPNKDSFNFAFDVIDEIAKETPDRLAIIHLDKNMNERRFTFGELSGLSARAANYFESIGIKRGDRVILTLKRHWQFWIILYALCKLGAVVIPATNMLRKHDFLYRFRKGGVSAVISTPDDDTAGEIDLACEEFDGIKNRIIVGRPREGWRFFDEEYSSFPESYERKADTPCGEDRMLMYFSSGTSGEPKLVIHTHTYPLGHFITAKYWHHVSDGGLHFTISDTGWGKAAWGKIYGQFMCGASVFVYDFDRFDANAILPLFAKYGIDTFCAPPTMFRMLIKEDLSRFDLSSIKYATTAGEALNPEVYNKFLEATGISLMEGFGQTETTLTIANLYGMKNKVGSMGKPSPMYDIILVDSDGKEVARGETGEVAIRLGGGKPCGLALGYYDDSSPDKLDREKTDACWYDGMYHTGDTAWQDEDGYFWFVGRIDDLIKSSGYRIGPFEIESVIMELPYVLECAVTGVPDEVRGQIVKATIVPTKNAVITPETVKEVQNYVKTHTAPYKYPRIVEFVSELPKTFNGKIKRSKIREK